MDDKYAGFKDVGVHISSVRIEYRRDSKHKVMIEVQPHHDEYDKWDHKVQEMLRFINKWHTAKILLFDPEKEPPNAVEIDS